jgi:RNA polymerase sigma-70 factor (ECF subfamily)
VPADPATDRANLEGLQRGDRAALGRLIGRWPRPLAGFAYRYLQNSADAQDMVAETFVRLYQRRERLRPDTHLAAWLLTTLTNLCPNPHRWRRRHPTVAFGPAGGPGQPVEPGLDPASPEAGPGDALVREEAVEALKDAVAALPHDL